MSVYGRQRSADPFRNFSPLPQGVLKTLVERAARDGMAAYRVDEEGVIDLIEIAGLWQEPPK
jgi:hypothetical protein